MNARQRNTCNLFARQARAFALACLLALCCAPGQANGTELPAPEDSVYIAAPAALPDAPGLAGRGAAPDLPPPPTKTPEQLSGAFMKDKPIVSPAALSKGREAFALSPAEKGQTRERKLEWGRWSVYALTSGLIMILLFEPGVGTALFYYLGLGLAVCGMLFLFLAAIQALSSEPNPNKKRDGKESDNRYADKKTRRRLWWRKAALITLIVSVPLAFIAPEALLPLILALLILLFAPRQKKRKAPPNREMPVSPKVPEPKAAPASDEGREARRAAAYVAAFALIFGFLGLLAFMTISSLALAAEGMAIIIFAFIIFVLLLVAGIVWLAGTALSALED